MNAGDDQKKDGLRVLFPTLIYEAWFPDYASIKQNLVDFNLKLRNSDSEGQNKSEQEYSTGFTSYFSRQDLHKSQEMAPLVSFLQQCAVKYGRHHHWDLVNYEPVINSLWGNINTCLLYTSDAADE